MCSSLRPLGCQDFLSFREAESWTMLGWTWDPQPTLLSRQSLRHLPLLLLVFIRGLPLLVVAQCRLLSDIGTLCHCKRSGNRTSKRKQVCPPPQLSTWTNTFSWTPGLEEWPGEESWNHWVLWVLLVLSSTTFSYGMVALQSVEERCQYSTILFDVFVLCELFIVNTHIYKKQWN